MRNIINKVIDFLSLSKRRDKKVQKIFDKVIGSGSYSQKCPFMCKSLFNAWLHNCVKETEYELAIKEIDKYLDEIIPNRSNTKSSSLTSYLFAVSYEGYKNLEVQTVNGVLNTYNYIEPSDAVEVNLVIYQDWANRPRFKRRRMINV